MSNKLVKMTPEQKKEQENEAYMRGKPSRLEVANYVNQLLDQKYVPQLHQDMAAYTSGVKLGIMIIQSILIDKGVCTGEEIEAITKEFMEKFAAESSNEQGEETDTNLAEETE